MLHYAEISDGNVLHLRYAGISDENVLRYAEISDGNVLHYAGISWFTDRLHRYTPSIRKSTLPTRLISRLYG